MNRLKKKINDDVKDFEEKYKNNVKGGYFGSAKDQLDKFKNKYNSKLKNLKEFKDGLMNFNDPDLFNAGKLNQYYGKDIDENVESKVNVYNVEGDDLFNVNEEAKTYKDRLNDINDIVFGRRKNNCESGLNSTSFFSKA